jgi:hypothetical protein
MRERARRGADPRGLPVRQLLLVVAVLVCWLGALAVTSPHGAYPLPALERLFLAGLPVVVAFVLLSSLLGQRELSAGAWPYGARRSAPQRSVNPPRWPSRRRSDQQTVRVSTSTPHRCLTPTVHRTRRPRLHGPGGRPSRGA